MRPNTIQNLLNRRNPEHVILTEAYAKIQEDDAVKYLVGAMEPIDGAYTKKTYEEGERIKNQITKGLSSENLSADYEYQGSVTKNTHIKAYSDLDLLVLERRFITLEPPQQPVIPYRGQPVQDLLQIRVVSKRTLTSAFPAATVDDSGPRSVKISGGSLVRTIDVVPANWWDTNQYVQTNQKVWRGVHVLDAHKLEREPDQPFIHGALIDQKDRQTLGNTRKLIRLLKSLKYDSEGKATMSSFDIESLVYRMDNAQMLCARGQEIQLASVCRSWLAVVEQNSSVRTSLDVPDGKRRIFVEGKATLAQLSALNRELTELLNEIEKGLSRSFRKLAEARIRFPLEVSVL